MACLPRPALSTRHQAHPTPLTVLWPPRSMAAVTRRTGGSGAGSTGGGRRRSVGRANNMASNRGWVTVSRYLVCVIGALASLSCATVKNTPQQDYTYEMGRICETSAGITSTKIQRVAPDGHY